MTIDPFPIVNYDDPVPLSRDGMDGDEPMDDLKEERMDLNR